MSLAFIIFKNNYLLLAVLGLHCFEGFSLVVASGGYSLVAVHGLLIAVASLFVVQGLQSSGSVVVTHRLSCPATCGILLDEGSNLCPLH